MTADLSFTTKRGGLSRLVGGISALIYPLALTVLAVGQGFAGSSLSGIASAFLAAILFLIAAPTAWVLAFDFIDVSTFTTVSFGLISSLPIWYFVGSAIAGAARDWWEWGRRYATVCIVWTAFNLTTIALLSTF